MDVLYGKPDNEKNEARWQRLRDNLMDCATFLFIAVSYAPLDISKMHQTETMGLDGKVVPPPWVWYHNNRPTWVSKVSDTDQYVRSQHDV